MKAEIKVLSERIEQAERDRMSKYYHQVAELAEWRLKIKDKIEESYQIAEAVANHFIADNQVAVWNSLTEVMLACLEPR